MNFLVKTVAGAALALAACQNAPGPSAQAPAPRFASADTLVPTAALPAEEAIDRDYLMGKFDPAARPNFARVGAPYTDKPGMMLRREALEAFERMWKAAHQDGITLKIISSTRTFAQQKAIWNGKWTRFAAETPEPEARARRILEYSAMPGASRHHWGTDIDLNDLNNPTFEPGGRYETAYQWLAAHAHEYGFCQPYTPKGDARPVGYNEEKWHWSYTPVSKPLLEQYRRHVTDDMLTGFEGADNALKVKAVEHYAAGVNPACQ